MAENFLHHEYTQNIEMFVLAGKGLTEGPKSNLLLKPGLTIASNQASQAFFFQPGFENPKESTKSGTTQSSRKPVTKFDWSQSEEVFSIQPKSISSNFQPRQMCCVAYPKTA